MDPIMSEFERTSCRTMLRHHVGIEPREPVAKPRRIEPEAGHTYLVKHAGGTVRFRLMHAVDRAWRTGNPNARAVWHWVGMNLKTGRVIELKSRAKFLEEVTA